MTSSSFDIQGMQENDQKLNLSGLIIIGYGKKQQHKNISASPSSKTTCQGDWTSVIFLPCIW